MIPFAEKESIIEDYSTPKIIRYAKFFGLIKDRYTLEDYLVDAVENGGYETLNDWGVQGVGKSTRMLQMMHWVYKDWDVVLENVIFRPSDFVKRLKGIPKHNRIPCIGWDDIGVHYTSSTFRTNILQYEAIDSAWAAIRTKCNVILVSIPLIDRLAKNIKDNLTFEIFIGRNQMEMIQRLVRLPGIKTLESNLFKITIEQPRPFNLYEVPQDVFKQYWEMRLQLTEEALAKLDQTVSVEDMENYMPVSEAAVKLKMSANTLQSYISRGVYDGRKVKGVLCLTKDAYNQLNTTRRQIGRSSDKFSTVPRG